MGSCENVPKILCEYAEKTIKNKAKKDNILSIIIFVLIY
jgi:hypothetical protein